MKFTYYICQQIKGLINMTNNSFSIRLRDARLMMGLSMDKLAERTNGVITKQSISRYEKGIMRPKRDALQAIAKALNISEAYFVGTNLKIDVPMLRTTSNGKLSEDELRALEAKLSFWAEQYLAKERMIHCQYSFDKDNSFKNILFKNPVKGTKVSTLEDAIHAADLLRKRWHSGDGPIASVLRLLERKGIKILSTELPDNVWGLSTWADNCHPLMVLDMRPEKTTIERLRFTAAHELAHLLLTFPVNVDLDVEKRCNKFAGFFLFTKQALIEEMGSEKRDELMLEEMIDLKELYGISIAAQVHAAWDIRMISREHYDWWFDEKIKKNRLEVGWGEYVFPETIGRERRMDVRIVNIEKKNLK